MPFSFSLTLFGNLFLIFGYLFAYPLLPTPFRVFLNLWFAKPMVCVRVAFHKNDGNHEDDGNDNDNSDSYKQGVECWIHGNHGNHDNYENHGNPGCKIDFFQSLGP